MTHDLPTAQQLEKLPLRAVAAYSLQTARRLAPELHDAVPSEVVDDVLNLIEMVLATSDVSQFDGTEVVLGAKRIVAAYADAPDTLRSLKTYRFILSIVHTATAAMTVCHFASDPTHGALYRERAGREAERAVAGVGMLEGDRAIAAVNAARRDYESLLAICGEHLEATLGDPIHCFDDK